MTASQAPTPVVPGDSDPRSMEPAVHEEPSAIGGQFRRLHLRYAGTCVLCGAALAKGDDAVYHPPTRSVRCLHCRAASDGVQEALIDGGVAGASARRQFERRKAAREARVKGQLGNFLGGIALAIGDEEQSTRAWQTGALGEERLAVALAGVANLRVLHDRRVRGTRGNIDHILIAPAGVFVVDSKKYSGLIRIRDRGGFFKSDRRLYVGNRDCSRLAENMGWQVEAVREALQSVDPEGAIPVAPVICFIDGEWPLLSPPEHYKGVRLEGKRSIKRLISRGRVLDLPRMDELFRTLAATFPPK